MSDSAVVVERACNVCKELLPLEKFAIDKWRAGGRSLRCRNCHNVMSRDWFSRNKEKRVQKTSAWRSAHPNRNRAHKIVASALERGELKKPAACCRCGSSKAKRIDAHHDDYDKPLDVMWLCRSCHIARHKMLDASAAG